jgi:crotonobetaine/carnitine-CoA ligase
MVDDDVTRWVLPLALEQRAAALGDKEFVRVVGQGSLTYAAAATEARQVASRLASVGVGAGDAVAVLLPSGLDFVRLWLALGRLGAVIVPLNTALEGGFLAHQLRDCGARFVVADHAAEAAVRAALGDGGPASLIDVAGWREDPEWMGPLPSAATTACIMYTSGTTGPSKGVLMPHAHCYLFGVGSIEALGVTGEDRYYVTMPLFHANGLFMQLGATLLAGATAVLRPRFSASAWVSDVREHGCTVSNLLGSMSEFVIAQPASEHDRDHALRVVCPVPNPPAHEAAWRDRFGVPEVVSAYGMTEVNIPLYGRLGQSRPGTAGLVLDQWFEVEVRDPDTDVPVRGGEVGEIMVRPRVPFGFMSGYHRLPEATVDAWRSFWFHTGDSGVMDEQGWVTFVDRTKDCIRRRGENISSFEVEGAVAALEGVAEVAAYAVPSVPPGTEDEVMLAVVASPGVTIDCAELVRRVDAVLPRFARPRYLEVVEELPRTPTAKVRKAELRRRAVTDATWDRESVARPT